ncbi:MAG TPA: hypothetical protein VIP77_22885 [Jiangellaceae bacterium]
MRPRLNPALCRVWREPGTVQFGITPGHAVVLGGMGRVESIVLAAMDGEHDLRSLRALAIASGGRGEVADRLVDVLTSAGAVLDRDATTAEPGGDAVRAPDVASLALVARTPDGGQAGLTARHHARVDVIGAGRVGATVARLLASGGVGEVNVDDPGLTRPADVSPGGLGRDAVGLPRERATGELLAAELPGPTDHTSPPAAHVAVVAPAPPAASDHPDARPDPGRTDRDLAQLLRAGVPHLVVQIVETTGIVGPFVVPGRTSCPRCHDMHRTDRDRAWPLVLHQSATRPPRLPACDASLATTVAGLAAGQVLAHLDGFDVATLDATIEIDLPYGLPRRRSWRPHPGCGCAWV